MQADTSEITDKPDAKCFKNRTLRKTTRSVDCIEKYDPPYRLSMLVSTSMFAGVTNEFRREQLNSSIHAPQIVNAPPRPGKD